MTLTVSAAVTVTTAPKKGGGNRFLFVVDTSSPMQRIEQGGRQAVFDLIYSGIENRMQTGDTFGIWTFGQEVKAGVFPMQVWQQSKSTDLATEAGRFLKEQSSGRKSDLDQAIGKAESLVKNVMDVDILIVTSAAARFKGDETWVVLLQNWKGRFEEARKSKKAMIVALAARGGRIVQATLTLEGEPLQLLLPPQRQPSPVAAKAKPTVPPKVAREPIIMQGPKPRPLDDIPTQFAPPPTQPPATPEPVPAALPHPVPVLTPEKPVVHSPNGGAIAVAAREPGQAPVPPGHVRVTARFLVIAGAVFILFAGAAGLWIILHARARSRPSLISQCMAAKPGDGQR